MLDGGRLPRGALLAGALIALAVTPPTARAALGELDTGFGAGGAAVLDPGPGAAALTSVALTERGEPVAAGWATGSRRRDLLVARLTRDGAPDPAFNGSGFTRLELSSGVEGDASLAVQPDGRIVTAITTPFRRGRRLALARFTTAGELDETFGDYGVRVLLPPGLREAHAAGVAVLPDGRLLVAGWGTDWRRNPVVFAARLTATGAELDPSFGRDGVAVLQTKGAVRATALAVDRAGRATISGQVQPAQGLLVRFTAAGQPDPSFHDGRVTIDMPESDLSDLALLPNGGIVAAGTSKSAGLLVRVGEDGEFDPSTDADVHAPATPTFFSGLAVDGGRAAIVAGAAGDPGALLLAKLDPTGRPDPTNDPMGLTPGFRRLTLASSTTAAGAAVALDGDEGATMVGHVFVRGTPRPLVTRHLPNAAPSAAVGGPGQVRRGSPARFDASGSADPERAIRHYEWDFDGDGKYETNAGSQPVADHIFPDAGPVTVGVRVTDHRGLMSTAQLPVRVVQPGRQEPPPQPGRNVVLEPVSGTVLLRPRGQRDFVRAEAPTRIANGSVIDARHGEVRLVVARDATGATDSARFWAGRFEFRQTGGGRPLTTLRLRGGSFKRCRRKARRAVASAAVKRKRRRRQSLRRLWGDGEGRFRTEGRYGAATVRGTRWLTEDRCRSTRILVRRGVVEVRDLTRRRARKKRVKAGHQRVVRAPRARRHR